MYILRYDIVYDIKHSSQSIADFCFTYNYLCVLYVYTVYSF